MTDAAQTVLPLVPVAPAAPPPTASPAPPVVGGTPASPRGLDPATRLQTILVGAVIAALFFGSQLLNEALPSNTGDVAAGDTVAIGEAATFTAVEGWIRSDLESGGVRLEKGVVVLDLFPVSQATNASELAQAYLDEVLVGSSSELTSSDIEVATEGAVTGARFRYQGIFTGAEGPIEGEVTAIVRAGIGVVADAWSPQAGLDSLIAEARQIVATIEIRP
jgi:hypothetical protein